MVKFSIVVPVYNVEKYLSRCINSLINQTLKEIEIILVDDGSPDSCGSICDEYAQKDNRIKVIHKKNEGVSAARNDGLISATGEWIIFCDSDDWMEENACELLYNEGIKKNVDVVIGDIYRVKDQNRIYNKFFDKEFVYRSRKELDQLVKTDLYQEYCILPPSTPTIGYGGPWNKAVKRSLLIENKIIFDTELLGVFDDILYTAYLYANAKSISYIQKPIYNYVLVSTSITHTYKANALDINRRIFKAFREFIDTYSNNSEWEVAYHAMVIRRFEEVLRLYFFSKKNTLSYRKLLRQLKQTMESEPYITATKNVETHKLQSHHKKLVFLMKLKTSFGIWVLYQLKIFLKKI